MNFKYFLVVFYLTLSLNLFAQEQNRESVDSLSIRLDRKIVNFLSTVPLHPDSLIVASDRLIDAGSDNNLSPYIAGRIYLIFKDSGIMGMESVSVHIAQKYFLSGKLIPPIGLSQIDLQLFTEFNKHSLLGMDAPELKMVDITGNPVMLSRSLGSKHTIVLFYDDECAVCKAELPALKKISESPDFEGLKLFAIFTHPDTSRLKAFIKAEFKDNPPLNWVFVSDPEYLSDFQRLYNVIKTPQIFLLDGRGKIEGRNLNATSLNELLSKITERDKEFLEQTTQFVAAYLESINYEDTVELKSSVSLLFNRITSTDDKEFFTAVFTNIYEELLYSEDENRREASVIVAENYIIPNSSLWSNPEYPLVWVPSMVKRTKANQIGSVFTPHKLLDTKGRSVTLGKSCSKYTLIYFTNPECSYCKIYTEILRKEYKSLKKNGVKIIAVNTMGTIASASEYKNIEGILWSVLSPAKGDVLTLFSIYEVESVPSSILLDRKGRIIAKNIDFATLKEITR